jgi:hypothetical protein
VEDPQIKDLHIMGHLEVDPLKDQDRLEADRLKDQDSLGMGQGHQIEDHHQEEDTQDHLEEIHLNLHLGELFSPQIEIVLTMESS